MMMSTVTMSTRKRCWRANWTMRWIMVIFRPRLPLVLQRILELQEQAAVADDALAFLEAIGDLRAAALTVRDLDEPACELVGPGLHVNKWLVLGVAEDGSIGNGERIANRAGLHCGGDVHIFLEFLAGVISDDARLQGARCGIERGSNERNFPVENLGIGIGGDLDGIARMHISEVALVDVDENPDGTHVRDGKNLGCAGHEQLAGTDEALDHFAADGSDDGNL